MNRIFCIIGKSASGKDTLYKEILNKNIKNLIPIIPYTTRPIRNGELNGENYNFITENQMKIYEENNQILERRQYLTTFGVWTYFTLKFNIEKNNDYIIITTLDGAVNLIDYYGVDKVYIIYLFTDRRIRLLRSIDREARQESPNYIEVCRRFIADENEFSELNLKKFKNIYYIDTSDSIENCIKKWETIYDEKYFF